MPLPNQLTLFRVPPPIQLPQPPLVVRVPEAWRAETFRPALEDAWLAFNDYARRRPRVARALGAVSLLEQLALVLDDYVAPAIVTDVNAFVASRFPGQNVTETIYLQYVAACLQGNGDPYQPSAIVVPPPVAIGPWAGIGPFYQRYPVVRYMISVMATQFVAAVLRCCDRLLEDWVDLGTFFFGGTQLASLTGIQGTGSDFHKGGQQVFILSLLDTAAAPRRLVYKPGDVERDFRVVGDTQALTAALGNLRVVTTKGVTAPALLNNPYGNGASLAEMVAAFAAADVRDVPVTKYRILPVHPGSSLVAQPDGSYDLRQSYGWIEYLTTDPAADRTFATQVDLDTYYKIFGTLTALCYLFQVTDMHQENVLIHLRRPYLIDLEMNYAGIMALPSATGLKEGFKVFRSPKLGRVVDGWNSPALAYGAPGDFEDTKNQPIFNAAPYTPVARDGQTVATVFLRAIDLVLRHIADFNGWIAATAGMISRIVPFGTAELLVKLRAMFYPNTRITVVLPDEAMLRTADFARTEPVGEGGVPGWGDNYIAQYGAAASVLDLSLSYYAIQPRFAFWLHPQTADDFAHGDIPTFYQRANAALDSKGLPIKLSYDRGIQMTAPASQVALATNLITLWGSATPVLPSAYFPANVATTQQNYLTRLQSTPAFNNARLLAANLDIIGWV